MNKSKKILVLANASGGLYRFRKELLSELVKSYDIYAATPLAVKVDELKNIGVELIDIPVDRRGINPITDFNLFIKYVNVIKRVKPDLVVTYTIKPNIYGGIASRLCHVKYATNITGLGTAFQKEGLLRKTVFNLYKVALKKAITVFFENSENLDFMVKNRIIREDQCCLLNGAGVNLNQYKYHQYPFDNNPFVFLFVGRVMKEKGIEELFQAMKKLCEEGFNCVLDVLGGYEEDYKYAMEKYTGEGWLRYHGYQDNVIPFIKTSNCFVLPSWHEGMANTNLECASIGRPIITTDIPGCKEAVLDNKSGLLCKPKDCNSLYEKMREMVLFTDDKREKMGLEGRKHMEKNFDKNAIVNKTIEHLYL